MSLDTIMNLQITVDSRAPFEEGFGTPLLFGHHVAWVDRLVKEYADPDEMLDDGFDADHYLYRAAQIVKSQDPSPETFKIGRRVTPLTQTVEITPTITRQGFRYKGTIGGKALSYTVGAAATPATIAAALGSVITDLGVGMTSAVEGDVLTLSAEPGTVVDVDLESGVHIRDVTEDTTTDNELPNIADEDFDFYGLLVLDSQSKATALNAAAWIETTRKILTIQSADTDILDGNVIDDTFSALRDSSYTRTNGVYHRAIGGREWLAAGWQAGRLTTQPGSDTWAFKEVSGVRPDALLQSHENAILAKNGSHYTRTGGLPITFEGKSGAGEYMDTIRFLDWVYARMRERVLFTLRNNPKIPFTDSGVDALRSAIMSVIQQGIDAGGFAAKPEPTVTAPLVRNVPAAQRINRTLPDVNWTAHLAGAVHRMTPVRGRVSV